MEVKRTTFIEIETRRSVFLVAAPPPNIVVYCPACGALEMRQPMLTAENAAAFFKISRRAVYRLIEQGAAHFTESANGEVLLCSASLGASLEKSQIEEKSETEKIEN